MVPDILAVKNVHIRLIISLIQDPLLTLLVSCFELPNNFFNEDRDRCLYRSHRRISAARTSFGSSANGALSHRVSAAISTFASTGNDATPSRRLTPQMAAVLASIPGAVDDPTLIPRNRTLRLRLLHVETPIEMICTIVAVRAPSPAFLLCPAK
jgi:hypothetical protein